MVARGLLTVFGMLLAYGWHQYRQVPDLPQLTNEIWGLKKNSEDIREFRINVSEEVLQDLQYRLDHSIPLFPPLTGIQFQYGFNTAVLQDFLTYWATKYDWRSRETFLNQFPQFQTTIQGLDIHFLHVKPDKKPRGNKIGLLLLHGWPGSFVEMYKILPRLLGQTKLNIEVVVPSLPGFGFSSASVKPGLGAIQMSNVLKNLMLRLGYKEFYVQGGDWGAIIAAHMATLFPQHVLGLHSNMCYVQTLKAHLVLAIGAIYPPMVVNEAFKHKLYPRLEVLKNTVVESGYFHLQATKPDTLGVGLRDSPAGLMAYILEKFSTGTNLANRNKASGGLLEKFTREELIDNVMIYWVTRSMTSAMRIYSEFSSDQLYLKNPITVPSACAKFPHEISYFPDFLLRDKYAQLVQSTEMPRGGHFAALEEPQLLAEDIISALQNMEAMRSVV